MIMQKLPQDRSEQEQRDLSSESWKNTYLAKLRESKETGVPLIALCKNDPAWMESHRKDLERLQRYKASGSDAPAPMPCYERGDLP